MREFVKGGTKEEAVMATRALCSYRVVRIDKFDSAPAIQDHVRQTCEVALGRAFYWMKRGEYDALSNRLPSARAN